MRDSSKLPAYPTVFFFLCGGGGGGPFHLHCFDSCREVDYPSFCFDDSYRMVVHLLLVLSYGFWDLRLFLFFVNFNQTQEIVFFADIQAVIPALRGS